ncbi:hypothetical protein ACO22_03980 [Paracoccidioides brasiliensis]|uniref:Cupin 2 conserved barrel domain-containing protein n=1 Tax=Paracoccidioides brasiliensis TaxID=121759 RepID=A0A1D2JEC9_PARBR|nr:hypothetical protein ACO22_03980 [Paracoccidioides brasiliensis]
MTIPSRAECEQEVRSWGFKTAITWNDVPHHASHSHDGLTTFFIRTGSLTISHPNDETVKQETFGQGFGIDVPGGKVQEIWIGPQGCEYVIGK